MPYYRRNLYVLAVALLLASASWYLIVPFLPFFIEDMGVEKSMLPYWIGIVFAAQSLASIVMQPFWGRVGDSVGRKPMILRAGFSLVAIYFLMSICNNPWQLAVLRFMNGALTGFIPGCYALIATNTPEELAPQSVASAQASVSVGYIAGPALGGVLASLVGYRHSMQIAGAAVLISTLLVIWLVQEPNKTSNKVGTSFLGDFGIALRSPVQSSILFAVMLAWMFNAAVSPYLGPHVKHLYPGVDQWLVGLIFSLPAFAFIITVKRWTSLGECWGFEKPMVIGFVGTAVGAIVMAFLDNLWTFGAFYFITGIWLAIFAPSISGVTITRVEESFRGRAFGIQQSAGMTGAVLAPLVAARLFKAYGLPGVLVFIAVVYLVGAFVFRLMIRKWPKPVA